MKVCSHCGTYNEEWMNICQKCGKSIENSDVDENYTPTVDYETEETPSTTDYVETVEAEENNETVDNNYKEESNSNSKALLLENMDLKLVIFVLLIILFVLLILVLKG